MNNVRNERARVSQERVQTAIDRLTEVLETLHHLKVFQNGNGHCLDTPDDEEKKDDDGPKDIPNGGG